MDKKRAAIDEHQLKNWNLLERFRQHVLPLIESNPPGGQQADQRRKLWAEDYFSAYLFAMLNPVVTSMRALCHVSHCRKMRQVTAAAFSPSSFSESQHLFDPRILERLVRDLARQSQGQGQGGDVRVRQALEALTAVDGTILRAVPRMAWAPAGSPGKAIRLHLHFNVFDQVPQSWAITPGNVSEPKVFAKSVEPGAMIVADRGYGHDFALLSALRERGVHFVIRLYNNLILEPLGPDRPLSPQDKQAGVVWDRQVRLGVHGNGPVFRVIRVEANGEVFHLVSTRQDLTAHLIGLIYRQRWQIELFFKWIKTILNCRHWLAESPTGVQIQIYCVLIASLLLMLASGQRPNKRTVEALQFYWSGLADEQDLITLLQRVGGSKKS